MSSPARFIHTIRIPIAICVFTFSLIVSPNIQAEEQILTKIVVTVGTSNVYRDDVSSARSLAISNSLVSAVAWVASDLILFGTMIQDFPVINNILFGRTNEFIQDYRVLNSARSGRRYSALVEATVLIGKMEEQLSRVGILLLKNALPRVLFFITEQDLSDPIPKYWWKEDAGSQTIYSENLMAITMQEKGFTVIDHDLFTRDAAAQAIYYRPDLNKQEILSLGSHYQADLVILGTSTAVEASNRMGDNARSYNGTVSARAFRTDSGVEVASSIQSFVAVGDNPSTGGADALSGAGRLAGADLVTQITAAWLRKMESLVGIEIFIKWAGNLADLVELRTAIAGIPGVKQLLPRTMSAEEVAMTVDFEGTEKELADNLMLNTFSSFGIHIFEMSENRLSIEITK